MNDTFMKEKPVFGLVLSMSLPMVLSMMVNALYNIVDSYFVARISEDAMTALSLVYPVQNLISATAIGFGVGINAVIAFFLGAGDKKKANQAATMGMFWSLVQGLTLSIVCILIMPKFLTLFTDDATVIDYAIRYSRIAFLFGMIISSGLSFEKTFQAVGRMKVSMLSMMAGCISNIVLDPILIFGLGPFPAMGIEGAALATGAGQVITLVIYIIIYMVKPIPVKITVIFAPPAGSMRRIIPNTPVTTAMIIIPHHSFSPNFFASTDIWIRSSASARSTNPKITKIRRRMDSLLTRIRIPMAIIRIPNPRSN